MWTVLLAREREREREREYEALERARGARLSSNGGWVLQSLQ